MAQKPNRIYTQSNNNASAKKKTISEIRQGDDTTTKMKKKRSLMGEKKERKKGLFSCPSIITSETVSNRGIKRENQKNNLLSCAIRAGRFFEIYS
jgi:hypothetical protein